MAKNIDIPDGWEVKKLGEVAEKVTKKNNINSDNILTISAQYGLINQKIFFNKKIASNDTSGYYLINRNDFAYNKSYSANYPYGAFKKLNLYDNGVVSTLYICFRFITNNINLIFMEHYFEAQLFNRYIYSVAQEGARNHGLLNITNSDFFNMPILLPPLAEQKKIAEILSLWDKAIQQTKDLIAYKEKYKKGLMQNLLTGKIRLNGYTDEWKTYKFTDLCNVYTNDKKLQINSNMYLIDGLVPIIDQGNTYIAGYTNNTKFLIKTRNDGYIIFGDHTRVLKYINFDFAIGADGTKILYSSSIILNKLLYYFLKNSKITNLGYSRHYKLLKKLSFTIPTSFDEQKAIADILSSADKEIELLNKQLNLYTEQKKGLMQNLLTGKVRV